VCDICGQALTQRKDDKPETVKARLVTYHEQTEPLKGFYEARGLLKVVPNQGGIEATNAAIMKVLGV
ncbi:MAG: adenylate kinase, partial [Oscillospiraceae bacterium]|nr:adenylate kinase [Oscillospiraceae bacterium]